MREINIAMERLTNAYYTPAIAMPLCSLRALFGMYGIDASV